MDGQDGQDKRRFDYDLEERQVSAQRAWHG